MTDLVLYGTPVSPFVRKVEAMLDGNDYFVGNRLSLADMAVGAQLNQLDLVVATDYGDRWPALAKHTAAMKAHPGFVDNLTVCQKMLGKLVPEKVDLS